MPLEPGAEAQRRLRGRNRALAGALVAFIVILFVVTIVKLKGGGG
jgi:hypothetical protein